MSMLDYGVKITPRVYDQDNNLIKEYSTQSNMITNAGMGMLMTLPLASCMNVAVVGTGVSPTHRKYTGVVHKVGRVITTNDAFFITDDATYKRGLQLSDGTSFTILSVNSNTECMVKEDTLTEATLTGCCVWEFEQQLLDTPIKSSTLISTVQPTFNGTTCSEVTLNSRDYLKIDITRTFQFDFFSACTLTEAGWGNKIEDNGSVFLFGRILLDEAIPLVAGHRFLITVTMSRLFDITDVSMDVLFGTVGTWNVTSFLANPRGFTKILGDGTVDSGSGVIPFLEPSATAILMSFLNESDQVLATFNSDTSFLDGNKYFRSWSKYAQATDFTTPIKKLAYGFIGDDKIITFDYDVAQTAVIDEVIRLKFIVKWGRTLPDYASIS